MSVTSIQFIGLFVVLMNTGAGLHILLPHFPGTPFEGHTSVIQYSPGDVSSSTWPGVTTCGDNGSLRCAPINLETITFTGAVDPSPSDIVGPVPHLRCCCASMTDILPKYKDPRASGKLAAHIFIEHGVAEAIPIAKGGRIDTWVTMHSANPDGITVTANAGTSGSVNIVFKPGVRFEILNSMTNTQTTPSHFLAYYLMGSGSGACTAVPSAGLLPCAPQTAECPLTKKTVAPVKPLASKKRPDPPQMTGLDMDLDCSTSRFP